MDESGASGGAGLPAAGGRGLAAVIRLFHGLQCEIGIFQNGEVMVSQPIPLFKSGAIFRGEIAIKQEIEGCKWHTGAPRRFHLERQANQKHPG